MDTVENAAPDAGSPGPLLAAERERQGLSRTDIAQRLHMSVSQVEALEIGDYERLPRGTFLRGFTRNYARVLGLDADAMVALLAGDAPREQAPGIVVPSQNIRFDPLGARLSNPYVKAAGIAATAIVLGFAALYWWFIIRPQPPAAAVRKPAASVPVELPPPVLATPADAKVATPAAADAATGAASPATSASPDAAAPASTPVPAMGTLPASPAPASMPGASTPPPSKPAAVPPVSASPEPAPVRQAARAAAEAVAPAKPPVEAVVPEAGQGVVRLAFKGAAWVEIKDGKGRVISSRNHAAGSQAEVAGRPPLSVVIGNAPEVRLSYNDKPVDLEPHTRVAVARLSLP
jgi:cytoskeleton protein RodZ